MLDSEDITPVFVRLPRARLFDILRMCTDVHMQRGFEPAYVAGIRECVERAIKGSEPVSEPLCVKPDAFAHWSDEECTWCWADRSEVNERPCQHHTPCLVCLSENHAACEHTS